ncbi:MAG: hypothetical protein M3322_08600, partial [Actinomycetota bacterium]|nr:hypothetical protein [Actinomycetota bacterium]
MTAVLVHALALLRARPGRAALTAVGIAAAAAMVGASVTVGYSLSTGFERAARAAGLADVVARFDAVPRTALATRVRALPNLEAAAYRLEARGIEVQAGDGWSSEGQLEGILPGRRGYAVVSGRDLSLGGGEALVERGLAREWGVDPGDLVSVGGYGGQARLTVVGIAVEPETIAFPLVNRPRVYAAHDDVRRIAGAGGGNVNAALLWATDPRDLDVMLTQARAAGFGVRELTFVTRAGVRVLVRRAGGLVIALLGAFSLVALAAAGLMLASSARAELQRRLEAIGLLRALGASPL